MPTKDRKTRILRRQQLDRRLARIDRSALAPPPGGWVRALRDALGMNGRQLCDRLGVGRSHLSHIEEAEASRAITMQTLDRAADALECEVVYALVPRAGSLDETLRVRARAVAASLVDRISGSMTLEDQATDSASREELIQTTADELLRTLGKALWDTPL